MKVIEKVLDTTFDKPSFQVAHGDLTLYVIANTDAEQDDWVQLIRQCKRETLIHTYCFTSLSW